MSLRSGGTCTSCGGAVVWVRYGRGRWRLVDADREHDCTDGGYRPCRRRGSRTNSADPSGREAESFEGRGRVQSLRKLIAAITSTDGIGR
jgi:hypothetical protein